MDLYKRISTFFWFSMESAIIINKSDPQVPPKFVVLQSVSCTSLNNMSARSIKSGADSNVSSELVFSNESVSPNTHYLNESISPSTHQHTSIETQSSMRTVFGTSLATPKRADKLPKQPESPKQQCGICCCCCY